MPNKIKLLLAISISLLPSNFLRVNAYKIIFGYKIISSKIGFRTIILVEDIELINCRIGSFNKFIGPIKVKIKEEARIGNHNIFKCPEWTINKENVSLQYKRTFVMGGGSMIKDFHYFDLAGEFILGEKSWIAGIGSQFWTHGIGVIDRDIKIGKDCYIGSAVRFSPGSGVGDNIILGIGSVLTKRIDCNNAMIAGVPAKIIKNDFDWKKES